MQIDTEDESSDRVVEYFGINDKDVPTCRIINLEEDMQKFVPPFKGLDAEEMKKWVASYLEGNLKVRWVGWVAELVEAWEDLGMIS